MHTYNNNNNNNIEIAQGVLVLIITRGYPKPVFYITSMFRRKN